MGYYQLFPWKNIEEAIDYELAPIGLSYKKLEEYETVHVEKYKPSELYFKYEKAFTRLPAGKIQLYSTMFEKMGFDPLPVYKETIESLLSRPDLLTEYPLIMSCFKPGILTQSQHQALPWLKEIMPEPWIEINPSKATELGIKDGDMVIVKSRQGSIEIKCRLTKTVDSRVVMAAFGWGNPFAGPESPINTLAPDDVRCPISNGNSSRCFLVSVSPQKGSNSHGH